MVHIVVLDYGSNFGTHFYKMSSEMYQEIQRKLMPSADTDDIVMDFLFAQNRHRLAECHYMFAEEAIPTIEHSIP